MSSHSVDPLSNVFVGGSTSSQCAPKRAGSQRGHLAEIRRVLDECRSDGCPCGATELYALLNHLETRRHNHRRVSAPYINVRHITIRYLITDICPNISHRRLIGQPNPITTEMKRDSWELVSCHKLKTITRIFHPSSRTGSLNHG